MRLIDADDLGVGRCSKDVLPAAYCAGWNGLLDLIEKAPTVDAVLVTRCKDCASTRKKDDYESVYLCDEVLICTNCEGGWQPVWPTHFCSYGCPREEHDAEPKE